MDTTISAQAQTSLTNTSTADTNAHNYYIARWVSPKLNQTSVAANTWTLEYAASEGNANANFPRSGAGAIHVCAYVWKPSNGTKYGNIIDGNSNTNGEEAGTTQTVINFTFSGSAVNSLTADDAVIVVELWAIVTQAMGTGYSQSVFYDGTTENSTSNMAARLETPENLTFSSSVIERACNQTISVSDSLAKIATKNRTASDTITVSDSLARLKTGIRSISETISLSDSLTKIATYFRTIGDTMTVSDAIQAAKIKVIGISETISVSDSIARLKTAIRAISETVSVSDSLAKVATKFRSMSETISIADAIQSVKLKLAAISQSISVSDSVGSMKTAIRAISETITVSDALAKIATKLRGISQTISVSESVSKVTTRLISISQSITVSDSLSRIKTAIRNISETISIADLVERVILGGGGQLFHRTINETITLTDSISNLFIDFIQKIGPKPISTFWSKNYQKQMKKWKPDWGKMLRKKMGLE